MKLNRKYYLDIAKIVAIFLVLFTHTGSIGNKLYTITDNEVMRFFYCMLDCLRTINNCLLFMVSGALLLGKEETIYEIFKKRVFRFVIVLVLFSFVATGYQCFKSGDWSTFSCIGLLKAIIISPVQASYWYLYSYISFLVMLPFLRKLAKMDERLFLYLILINVGVSEIFPIIRMVLNINHINFSFFMAEFVVAYPLYGYYLESHWDEISKRKWIYPLLAVLSTCGITFSTVMTLRHYSMTGEWTESYICMFDTFLMIFAFVTIKKIGQKINGEKIGKLLSFFSSTVFGIYLLEFPLKDLTSPIFVLFDSFMPTLFACVGWLLVTMILGSIIVGGLKKIPGLGRLL